MVSAGARVAPRRAHTVRVVHDGSARWVLCIITGFVGVSGGNKPIIYSRRRHDECAVHAPRGRPAWGEPRAGLRLGDALRHACCDMHLPRSARLQCVRALTAVVCLWRCAGRRAGRGLWEDNGRGPRPHSRPRRDASHGLRPGGVRRPARRSRRRRGARLSGLPSFEGRAPEHPRSPRQRQGWRRSASCLRVRAGAPAPGRLFSRTCVALVRGPADVARGPCSP